MRCELCCCRELLDGRMDEKKKERSQLYTLHGNSGRVGCVACEPMAGEMHWAPASICMRRTGMSGFSQVAEYEPAALSRTNEGRGGGMGSSVACTRGVPAVPAAECAPCPREDGAGVLRQDPGLGFEEGSGGAAPAAEGDSECTAHAARASSSTAATALEGASGGTAAAEGHRKAANCLQAACASIGLAGGPAGGAVPAALDSVAAEARCAKAPHRADGGMHAEVPWDPGGCDLRGGKRQRV